jgi:hypothetical protein
MVRQFAKFTDRFLPLIVTIGLVGWLERVFTIEWSYPYCLSQTDGPAYAVQGMPLPYRIYSGISSTEDFVMFHVYAVNLLVLCILVFPLVRWMLRVRGLRRLLGVIGGLLFLSLAATEILNVAIGADRPVWSLDSGDYLQYRDLRPVRLAPYSGAPDCSPSKFWFPHGWRHK